MSAHNFTKIVGGVVLLMIIVFGFLYVNREQKIANYMKELERIENEIETKNNQINKVMNRLTGQQDQLLNEFNDVTVLLSDQMGSRQIGEEFFRFLEKPESRRIYREQQGILIDEIFNDLYDNLGLTDAEVDELSELLVDKEMINLEILVSLIKGNMTDDQKAENERKFNDMIGRAESNIRDFFEIDEYEIYQNYLTTLEYRNFIKDYKYYLAASNLELDFEQEEKLFQEIRNETDNFNFTEDPNLVELRRQSEPNSEYRRRLTRYLDERAELDDLISDRSREFLTESQYEKLKEFQIFKRNMTEMGFEVTSEMDIKKGAE